MKTGYILIWIGETYNTVYGTTSKQRSALIRTKEEAEKKEVKLKKQGYKNIQILQCIY